MPQTTKSRTSGINDASYLLLHTSWSEISSFKKHEFEAIIFCLLFTNIAKNTYDELFNGLPNKIKIDEKAPDSVGVKNCYNCQKAEESVM